MEEKPKSTKKSNPVRGKSFYVAMYSSLGGLLVLAIAIGYYNFIGFGGFAGDTHVAELSREDLWQTEVDNVPVGNNWDQPITGQPPQNRPPEPTPPPTTTDEDARDVVPQATHTPRPGATTQVTPPPARTPSMPELEPEGADDGWWDEDAVGITREDEADIYSVFDVSQPPQDFADFNEEDGMHWPILGTVLMDFAMDRLVYDITLDQWRTNDNVAISAERGDAVRAAAAGRVTYILDSRELGHSIVIDHGNGWVTTYSQLDPDMVVDVGDVVSRGQIIGSVGSPSIFGSLLGYHVNFAVRSDDTPVDPNTLLMATD